MKIKIKYHNNKCKIESFGNWLDLKSAENVKLEFSQHKLISLGVSMKLPKYYQANIVPRSSTYTKFGLIQANHIGIIDGPDKYSVGYCGNDDIWKFSAICLKQESIIKEGDRICQFEIRPTMKAPLYIKLKWLFDHKIDFIEVDDLNTENRGGFGSTGIK
jgi:dUTP pyrophosphatase